MKPRDAGQKGPRRACKLTAITTAGFRQLHHHPHPLLVILRRASRKRRPKRNHDKVRCRTSCEIDVTDFNILKVKYSLELLGDVHRRGDTVSPIDTKHAPSAGVVLDDRQKVFTTGVDFKTETHLRFPFTNAPVWPDACLRPLGQNLQTPHFKRCLARHGIREIEAVSVWHHQ